MALAKPTQITVPFSSNGVKNTIPETATGSNLASMQEGFPVITMTDVDQGGIPPQGQDMNGILFDVTKAIQYQQAGGLFPYDATFAQAIDGYPLGALLTSADGTKLYRNLLAGNQSDPENGGLNWVAVPTVSDLSSKVDINGGDVSLTVAKAKGTTLSRKIENRLSDIINVKDFGAKGDGVTDDTAAVQSAISKAHSNGGGTVFFPAGNYRINSLEVNQGTSLVGDGKNSTKLHQIGYITVFGRWNSDGTTDRNATETTVDKYTFPTRISGFHFIPEVDNLDYCIKTGPQYTLYGGIDWVQIDNCIFEYETHDVSLGYPAKKCWKTVIYIGSSFGASIVDCYGHGSFNCETNNNTCTFLKSEGAMAGLSVVRTHLRSFFQCAVFGDDTEGFVISQCEWIYCYDGVFCSRSTNKPGGWINQLHVNCCRYGVFIEKANSVSVSGLYVFRGASYFSSTGDDWRALSFVDCEKFTASDIQARPGRTVDGWHGDRMIGVFVNGCANFNIVNVASSYADYHVYLSACQNGSIVNLTTFSGTYEGYADSNCSNVIVRNITNNGTTNVFNRASATPVIVGNPAYEVADSASQSISSDTTETLTITANTLIRRTVSKTWTVTLATGKTYKGIIVDFLIISTSAGSVTITSAGDSSAQVTLSGAGTSFIRLYYTGSVWRKLFEA